MVVKDKSGQGTIGHRERQALATKKQVAGAARPLFAELGYVATTIAAISDAAQIPAQTIYSAFGNKAAILREVARLWIVEAHTRRLSDEALAVDDPAERLRLAAHWQLRQFETGYDVITIYQQAAQADPRMAEEMRTVWGFRERELEIFLGSFAGQLAAGLTPSLALDIFLTCTLAEVYRTLVLERGWTGEEYELWLANTLITQLL